MPRTKLSDRILPPYTKGEEVFNMVTHITGGALGITATTLCVIMAALHHNVMGIVSGAIYGFTMIVLYTMSSIYHGLSPKLQAKKVFQIIDHCAIFLLIAGTYTPITLCTIRAYKPWLGWTIFGFVWGIAALGITLNSIDLKQFRVLSMVCYIGTGWCILVCIRETFALLTLGGSLFLLAGGIFYTVGVVFFLIRKKFFHSIFHIFVVMGSLLHFFCILFYVM